MRPEHGAIWLMLCAGFACVSLILGGRVWHAIVLGVAHAIAMAE